jgi:hypothetical protein
MAMSPAVLLYPELRTAPPAERGRLLARARKAPFDVLELLGMAAILVGTALVGQEYLVVAVAAAAALVAPFFVRRTRRALRMLLAPR